MLAEMWTQAALTFVVGVLTVIILFLQIKANKEVAKESREADQMIAKQSTSAELLADCNRRYDELITIMINGGITDSNVSPDLYYRRFWSLQFDQYNYRKLGFLDAQIFQYWMQCRHDDWNRNPTVGGKSYQDSWAESKTGMDWAQLHCLHG